MQPRHLVANRTVFSTKFLRLSSIGLIIGLVVCAAFTAIQAQPASYIGPGIAQVGSEAPRSNASSSKAGSLLFFHLYNSYVSNPAEVNTLLTLTNTNPVEGITVRLIAVHDCITESRFINLAANQSRTLLASKEFPNTTGYLIAVAVSPTGAPTQFNWLIGSASVRDWFGREGSYNAFAVAKRSAGSLSRNDQSFQLNFDGNEFDQLPRVIAADNLQTGNAGLVLYSPLPELSAWNGTDPVLEATAYDHSGKAYVSGVQGYACGLIASAVDTWLEHPVAELFKAEQPGWAAFKATDQFNPQKAEILPVLGVSFNPLSDEPKSGAVALQVLEWLPAYRITLNAITPNITTAPEPITAGQGDAVGGATGMSESKAGSILLFPRYASGNLGDSRVNLTNTHPAQNIRVRLFFSAVSPRAEVTEKIIEIEPQQAISLNADDIVPDQRGWVMAVAINAGAQPIKFNYLIGSVLINETGAGMTTFNALAVAKNSDGEVTRDKDAKTVSLNFDDTDYDRLPATWAMAAVANQSHHNSSLSYNRFSNSVLEAPSGRGAGTATVFSNATAAHSGLLAQNEVPLKDLVKARFTPPLPDAAINENAGWMKLSLSTPSLAVISNFATAPIAHLGELGFTGGLSGSNNLHILTTNNNFTVNLPAGNPGNKRPVAEFNVFPNTIEARRATGTIVRLNATPSRDPDPGDRLTYEWYVDKKLISNAVIADYRLSIGLHEIKLVVMDTSGEYSDPVIQSVEIKDTLAPTISRLPRLIEATTTGTSAVVNYSLPIAFDSIDGAVNVTASRASGSSFPVGVSTVIFTAEDRSGNKATAQLDILVSQGSQNTHRGGEAGSATPFLANLSDQYLRPGEVRKIELQADDADGDPVFFRLSGAPPNVVLGNHDPVARRATLFIGPLPADRPLSLMTIQVSDNNGQSYSTVPFRVALSDVPNDGRDDDDGAGRPGNRPPVAVIAAVASEIDATEADGIELELNGLLSTDPDIDSLTYQWSENGQTIALGAIVRVKFGLGVHVVELKVSDGRGGVSTASVRFEVRSRPLSIISISPVRIARNSSVRLEIKGTGFAPGARLFVTGSGVDPEQYYAITESSMSVLVRIADSAQQGARNVIIINPDGKTATLRAGLIVQ